MVEAASSIAVRPRSPEREVLFATRRTNTPSLTQCYTQTKIGGSIEPPIFNVFIHSFSKRKSRTATNNATFLYINIKFLIDYIPILGV